MNTKRRQRIEQRIAAAVALVRRLGFQLVARRRWGATWKGPAGGWQDTAGLREVCICGAIALAENPKNGKDIVRAVAKKLGITVAQAYALSDGFEGGVGETAGSEQYPLDKTWYRIGRKWRERADRVGPGWL